MMVTIYALKDNEDIFYIGQCKDVLKRVQGHLRESLLLKSEKDKRIQDIVINKRHLGMSIIKQCSDSEALKTEKKTIIEYYRKGYALLNYNHVVRAFVFTDKELRILQLMADDNNYEDISKIIWLSRRTVETIVQRMKHKAQVRNTSGLIYWAYHKQFIQ